MSNSTGTDIRARVALLAMVATTVLLSLVSAVGYRAAVGATRQSQVELLNDRLDELEGRIAAGDVDVTGRLQPDLSLRVIRVGDDPPQFSQDGMIQVIRQTELPGIDALVGRVSTRQIDATLRAVRTGLWASVAVIGLVVGATAWIVVDRALSPVRDLTRRAKEIEADEAHELLPVTESGDEIAELAMTFNSMLTRLRSADGERRRFVSDASHELRTPLMVLSADAEYALEHGGDSGVLAESVLDQTGRLTALVDDLLTLASLDEGHTATDEARTVAEVLDSAGAHSLAAGIDERVAALQIPDVSRSVANVVANARRHGTSTVRVAATAANGGLTLHIDDDGPGVPADQRTEIFKRFYRPDGARTRTTGGAGLGLAIAKAEVNHAGGSIAVNHSPLGGARFTIIVPVLS